MQGSEELTIFVKWTVTLKWILNTTQKFPKRVRFTFSSRIDNLALDVLEGIIEAKYTKHKGHILKKCNLNLEKLRVLFRFCHDFQFISHKEYEHISKDLNASGNMLGGWIKEVSKRHGAGG